MLALLTLLSTASAQTTLSASPMGALGFTLHNIGDFAVNLEHQRGPHGVLLEASGLHVHGNPTHTTLIGGGIGYRLHFGQGSFAGVLAGAKGGHSKYKYEHSSGNLDAHWRYEVRQASLIPHIGHRWHVGDHLRITARFGLGVGQHWLATEERGEEIQAATQLLSDRLQFTPIKLDSELSLGWTF